MDRNLAIELVRVSEFASLAASKHIGRGNEKAADQAGERCSALSLPERTELLSAIPSAAIQLDHCLNITQTAAHPKDLLKPMLTTGACVTQGGGLSTAGWRKLFRAWPVDPETGDAMLSWRILFVILKR